MTSSTLSAQQLSQSRNQSAFQIVKLLVGSYLSISLGAIVVLIALRNHPSAASQTAWVHGIIVATTALLMTSFAIRTTRGHSRSYLRLRIASAIMLVAIAVIVAIPGDFPMWMKIEQGVCGLLLLGVVMVVNGKRFQSIFALK